jgi:hypothetical protein
MVGKNKGDRYTAEAIIGRGEREKRGGGDINQCKMSLIRVYIVRNST